MRKRFNPNSVASSDGNHIMVSHDRPAGTTGRTAKRIFARCGKILVQVTPVQAAMLAPYQLVKRL